MLHDVHRLAGSDAGFLFIETPSQTSVCVDLVELAPATAEAPALTLEDLRRHVEARLPLLPAWRWRLAQVPLRLHHPVWVEDPDFELGYHLRTATLPAPGGPPEVEALMAELEPQRLDLRHPLWQLILVDGLAGDRQAIVLRFHHAMADGAALIEMLDILFHEVPVGLADPRPPRPELPTRSALLKAALREQARNWRAAPQLVRTSKARFAAVEERRAQPEVAFVPKAMGDSPGTVLNRPGPPARRYARTMLPLPDLQAVRRATDATLNDVVLAVVAGAVRTELLRRGELPAAPLVANVPVAGAPSDEPQRTWGNSFSNFFCSLATDVADPLERVAAIAAGTAEAKRQLDLQGRDTLPSWLDRLPPAVAEPGARMMVKRSLKDPTTADFNVLVSNVRIQRPDYAIGGRPVERVYLSGPIADNAGLNITVVGFRDELVMTVVASPVAIDDAHALLDLVHDALDELVDACTA
jgi:WS/DGAT/MGAT family acyltransferase